MVIKTTRWFFLIFLKLQNSDFFNAICRKSHTRAQFKIQQTAFVLMAITLFFVLVGIFILTIMSSGLKESATNLAEKNALLLVSKLADSPEFSCGEAFGNKKINCVDADKVMMLKENIINYGDFWDVENIEIRKIYPKQESEIICTFENYPDCNLISLHSQENYGVGESNFVSLCRKQLINGEVHDKCELAKLIVSYKSLQ